MHMSLIYIIYIYICTFVGPLVGGFNPFQRYKLSDVLSNRSPETIHHPGIPAIPFPDLEQTLLDMSKFN